MVRGLYIATSGMLNETHRQDVIANNLANANTTGFKRDIPISKAFPTMLLRRIHDPKQLTPKFVIDPKPVVGRLGNGVNPEQTISDFVSPSNYEKTDNVLDLAILGDGFFVVQTPAGEHYTRNGNFVLDRDHYLTTTEGHRVLGKNGPIRISGSEVDIERNGDVTVNGEVIDQLQVVDFAKPYELIKMGNSHFVPANASSIPRQIDQPNVHAGTLEISNVNVIAEMVELITISRAYEANARVVRAQDEAIGQAVNNLGKARP